MDRFAGGRIAAPTYVSTLYVATVATVAAAVGAAVGAAVSAAVGAAVGAVVAWLRKRVGAAAVAAVVGPVSRRP